MDQRRAPAAPEPTRNQVRRAPRLDYVDGVRAAAAMYVVLHHSWLWVWPGYPHNDGPWWMGWVVYGHIAVAVFIVVSGFSLGLAPAVNGFRLNGGARMFYRRRAWRILPAYWAAIVFATLVLLITGPVSIMSVSIKGTVVHALLLQDIFGSTIPNGAFWSIAIEAQIYVVFPLLVWFRRRFNLPATVAVATGLATVAYLVSVGFVQLHRIQSLVPQFAALFVMGMAGAELAARWHSAGRRLPWARVAGIGALVIMAWIAAVGSEYAIAHLFWLELCIGAVVALGLAGLADGTPRLARRILESRPSRWFGAISYSSYLIHATILMLVWVYVVSPFIHGQLPRFLGLLAVGVPLAVLISNVFSRAIEQPTQRYRSFRGLVGAASTTLRPLISIAHRRGRTETVTDEPAVAPEEASA